MKSYFKKEEKLFPIKGTEHFYAYRWFFIPFLIVWLHNFEVLTYGGGMDGPTNYFLLLISSILCLQVYLLTIRTGPKWQQYLYKIGLFLVSVNILLGFFTIHSKREGVRFTQQDQKNIHRKDKHYLTGLKLLDTNNAYVVGKFSKRIYPLVNLYFVENHELTVDQQFKKYENLLLPNDFETYWKLIDTTSKNTSERLIGDYYGWQYFDYDIYIY